jgi:hypothetical protein
MEIRHHGTATLNFCTCVHLIHLTRSLQATPIRPRCRQQQVEMCPKGSYRWITPSVSACLPELCLSSGSIRISGVTAHNICIAGLCVSVLYLYHGRLTRQHHPCSLTCHASLRINSPPSISLGTWNSFLARHWLTSVHRVSLSPRSKLPGCSCHPPPFPSLSCHFLHETTPRLLRLGI